MLTVAQLLAPMTAAQFRTSAVAILQGLGLQPQNWATGGIASSVLTTGCNVLAGLSTQLSNGIAQMWNPTASGGGLQLLSQYVYGVTPPQATFASGSVTLTNSGGGIYSYGIGQATFASTVANAQGIYPTYTNTAAFSLPAGPSSVSVPVQCVFAGTAGNASPGFVTQLVTAMLGVTVTNPLSITGSDALSDPALRLLNVASIAVQSVFGPRGAYQYAIQTAVNSVSGLPVNVNRWSISIASHAGDVSIIVASPTGPVSTTDLQGISNNIEKLARPDAVTVLPGAVGYPSQPASATAVNYTAGITAYVLAPVGVSASSLASTISAALTTWFSGTSNPIGGLVASDDSHVNFDGIFESGVSGVVAQAIATVPGCSMLSTRFTGTSDLALTSGQVAVWAGTVTVIPQYSS